MNDFWVNEQARQRIADLEREAAGTELLRAARRVNDDASLSDATPTELSPRRAGLNGVRGTFGRVRTSLAAITPWSGGFRRG